MNHPLSVSEVVLTLKREIESSYYNVTIFGEVSDVYRSFSGHIYFTLSDALSSIRCVLFKNYAVSIKETIKDGERYVLHGSISLYEKKGDISFLVRGVTPFGEGQDAVALRMLKKKLRDEGLFDDAKKRLLPRFVERLGVISAPNSAAFHDIVTTAQRNYPAIDIVFAPALVQGESAEQSLLRALSLLQAASVDVVVISRGGGSDEDLSVFNSEQLARAVHSFPVPVLSAVGHSVDSTILDLTADKSVATPTAAAELVTEGIVRTKAMLPAIEQRLFRKVVALLDAAQIRADSLARAIVSPSERLRHFQFRAQTMQDTLQRAVVRTLEACEYRRDKARLLLQGKDPFAPLERGYTVIKQGQRTIGSYASFDAEAPFEIRFKDGIVMLNQEKKK